MRYHFSESTYTMKTLRYFSFLLGVGLVLVISCKKDDPLTAITCDTTGFNTTDITYTKAVLPLLTNYGCLGCHSASSKQGGVNLEGYAQVKKYVDNDGLLGSIAHLKGFDAMPQGGNKMSQTEICQVKFWIDNGALNN